MYLKFTEVPVRLPTHLGTTLMHVISNRLPVYITISYCMSLQQKVSTIFHLARNWFSTTGIINKYAQCKSIIVRRIRTPCLLRANSRILERNTLNNTSTFVSPVIPFQISIKNLHILLKFLNPFYQTIDFTPMTATIHLPTPTGVNRNLTYQPVKDFNNCLRFWNLVVLV